MTTTGKNVDQKRNWWIGDISGAFADLGTFLPLVIGLLLIGQHDPSGLMVGFGLFALATGLIYRKPIPVQPMKVVVALAIAGGMSAGALAASGLLLGMALIVLSLSGLIDKLDRIVPRTVLFGVQLGLGLHLVVAGMDLAGSSFWLGVLVLAVLLAFQAAKLSSIGCLALLLGSIIWSISSGNAALPSMTIGWHLPSLIDLDPIAFREALETGFLPQLALTITNAVILTAVLAKNYFPKDYQKTTPKRLAMSSGGLNLILIPFGAVPMCHGAGGLAAHYHQGARSGLAPIVFGSACLILGLFFAKDALTCLLLVPLPVVAAVLAFAGLQLANPMQLVAISRVCLAIVLTTALVSVLTNVAVGLVFGLIAELLRSRIAPLRQPTS